MSVKSDNPVRWFEIYVQDMARAKAFYESVFQVKLERLNSPDSPDLEMWAFPSVLGGSGSSGALVRMEGGPSGGNTVLIYFACEDCAIEAERVATFGGRVERPKFAIGEYGYIALVRDPEGNMIGLHSMTQSVDRP